MMQLQIPVGSGNLPTTEDIKYEIQPNDTSKCCMLSISINKPGWIIKGIIIENQQLFSENNGMHFQMQTVGANTINVELKNDKNTEQLLKCKVITGQGIDSNVFHTLEIDNIKFKSFQMFCLTKKFRFEPDQESSVIVNIPEVVNF